MPEVIGVEDEGVLARALLTDAEVVLSEAGSAGDWITLIYRA